MEDISTKKDDILKEELSAPAFEALAQDFSNFMSTLDEDPAFSQIRLEHEKLFKALKKSYNQEKRLLKRCRELNGEVLSSAAKLQSTQKLFNDDESTVDSMRRDVEKAWSMADESHKKELKALDAITQLQEENSRLNTGAENSRRHAALQESSIEALTKQNIALTEKNDQEMSQIRVLEQKYKEERTRAQRVEAEVLDLNMKLRNKVDEGSDRQNELLREKKRGEKIELELQAAQSNLEKTMSHCSNLQLELDLSAREQTQTQKELNQISVAFDKCTKDFELVSLALKKSDSDLLEQKIKNDALSLEIKELLREAKVSRAEQFRLSTEKSQLEKKINERNQSINRLKKIADDAREALLQTQTENNALNQEQETLKSREDRLRRDMIAMEREKDLHLSMIQKSQAKVKNADTEVHKNEQIHLSLEKELVHVKEEVKKQQSIIRQLEREVERGGKDASDFHAANDKLQNDLIIKQLEITELQQKISENEVTSRQQQQEATLKERSKYSRQVAEDQRELEQLTNNIKILTNQVSQLKEDINTKELEIAKKAVEHQKEHVRHDRYQNDLFQTRKLLLEAEAVVEQRDADLQLLSETIRRMEEDSTANVKEKEQTFKERDILATQLVRRNDELALLYEKIKILQTMLQKGEFQYQERIDDIRSLMLKIKDLQREKATRMLQSIAGHKFKRELIQTHRELLEEKSKVKSLSEELENPLNIHRWRKLEGTDPESYDLIRKVQSLQKRLIQKTDQLIEKDAIIQKLESDAEENQKRLSRQPGPDITAQLAKYKRDLNEKARQVDALKGEVMMYQAKYTAQQEYVESNNTRQRLENVYRREEKAKKIPKLMKNVDDATQRQKLKEATEMGSVEKFGGVFLSQKLL